MDAAKLRAWWFARQGLGGRLAGATPAAVLSQSGWARSVAGANPYLTLLSRAGTSRQAVDLAVENIEIHELPAARGCTYVVGAEDFALALRVGASFAENGDIRTAKKSLGVTEEELQQLCERVLEVLSTTEAMDPRDITNAVGNAARSLGEEGKKRGTSNTTPLAFSRLQSVGKIRRKPVNGRLDQQRYGYIRWDDAPQLSPGTTDEEATTLLAYRYFKWIGPSTAAQFQAFAGLGVKAAAAALQPLRLEPISEGSSWLLLPEDRAEWQAFEAPLLPQYALVASMDSLLLHRRDLASLVDESDIGRQVMGDKALVELGKVSELSNHAILDRGRLVGLWEFDPDAGQIVYDTFVPMTDALEEAIRQTEAYARDQLGDVRSFSLDSPKSRQPKIEALRQKMKG